MAKRSLHISLSERALMSLETQAHKAACTRQQFIELWLCEHMDIEQGHKDVGTNGPMAERPPKTKRTDNTIPIIRPENEAKIEPVKTEQVVPPKTNEVVYCPSHPKKALYLIKGVAFYDLCQCAEAKHARLQAAG